MRSRRILCSPQPGRARVPLVPTSHDQAHRLQPLRPASKPTSLQCHPERSEGSLLRLWTRAASRSSPDPARALPIAERSRQAQSTHLVFAPTGKGTSSTRANLARPSTPASAAEACVPKRGSNRFERNRLVATVLSEIRNRLKGNYQDWAARDLLTFGGGIKHWIFGMIQ
jgi:hypothetical protein